MAGFDTNTDYIAPEGPYVLKGISYELQPETMDYIEPVSVDEFKAYASIDGDTFDEDIIEVLTSARVAIETYCQLSFGIRDVIFQAIECPKGYLLKWGKVGSINTPGFTEFNGYLKEGGKEITVSFTTTDYYGQFADIKLAIKKQAYNFYENKDQYGMNLPNEVTRLVSKYRHIQFP